MLILAVDGLTDWFIGRGMLHFFSALGFLSILAAVCLNRGQFSAPRQTSKPPARRGWTYWVGCAGIAMVLLCLVLRRL
jgi:hypothetical protein